MGHKGGYRDDNEQGLYFELTEELSSQKQTTGQLFYQAFQPQGN